MRWICLFAVVFLVVFVVLAAAQNVGARAVSVCVNVELPKPGKCKYFNHRGYKVRVCK